MKKRNKAFITGIAGFAGSYLAERLRADGFALYGNLGPGETTKNIAGIEADIGLERCDILKPDKMSRLLKKVRPDYLFHLAAFASVGKSFEKARIVYDINFTGTLNLFEAARAAGGVKKLVFISSSEVYGLFRPKNKTLTEDQPIRPLSPYGISKAAGEFLAGQYVHGGRLPVTIARSFNHTGPRQATGFVVPDFASQISAIERGKERPVIKVGDLSARRDLADVRDIVDGYLRLALRGKPGRVYQLSTGRAVAIDTILDKLMGQATVKIARKLDRTRLRPADIPVLRGSSERAAKELGWKCRYKLNDTLRDTLNYWREKR